MHFCRGCLMGIALKSAKSALASMVLLACSASVASAAGAGSGTVTFSGEILESACSITPESVDQPVPLGSVSKYQAIFQHRVDRLFIDRSHRQYSQGHLYRYGGDSSARSIGPERRCRCGHPSDRVRRYRHNAGYCNPPERYYGG